MKSVIEQKIRKRTRGVVFVNALYGVLLSLLFLVCFFYAYAAWIFFFPDTPRIPVDMRLLTALFILGPASVAGWVFFMRDRDTRRLVMTLEQSYPQLKDRLMTAMEVSQRGHTAASPFSRALAKNLEHEMTQIISRFGFRRALSLNRLLLPIGMLALVVLCGTAHAILQPKFFNLSYQRMTQPGPPLRFPEALRKSGSDIPQMFITVSPGDCEVPKGSNLLIQAEVKGGMPKEVQLLVKQKSDPAWRIFVMKSSGGGKYQYLLTHLTDVSTYFVKADAEESAKYRIDLFEPLTLIRTMWLLSYPPHTALPEESREGWGPKLTVPAGTTLHLSLQLNRPVRSGKLLVQGDRDVELQPDGETRLKGSFKAEKDMVVRLDVKSTDGEPLMGISSLWIQTLPDLTPYLEVLQPQLHNYVFPTEEIPFEINVDDDYGIGAVDLVVRARGQEHRLQWLPESGEMLRKGSLNPVLRLEEFHLESRDIVFAFVEVRDNHPEEPHVVKSPLFTFLIRDYVEQFKLNSPEPLTPSLRSLFEDILVEQERIMSDAWDYHSRIPGDEPKGWDEQGRTGTGGAK